MIFQGLLILVYVHKTQKTSKNQQREQSTYQTD